ARSAGAEGGRAQAGGQDAGRDEASDQEAGGEKACGQEARGQEAPRQEAGQEAGQEGRLEETSKEEGRAEEIARGHAPSYSAGRQERTFPVRSLRFSTRETPRTSSMTATPARGDAVALTRTLVAIDSRNPSLVSDGPGERAR